LEVWNNLASACFRPGFRAGWSVRIVDDDPVSSTSLSVDGCWLVTGGFDKTVRLWEMSTGRCLRTFYGHTGSVSAVSLSTDKRWVVSGGSDGTMRLWEASTGICLRVFQMTPLRTDNLPPILQEFFDQRQEPVVEVSSVCLSTDGRWLVSGGSSVRLWEVSTGRCLRVFGMGFTRMSSVSLSADGRWLMAGGNGNSY